MKDRSLATALHIMTILSKFYPERVSSEMLASSAKTNPGLIRRLLSKLSKAGLVDSKKGKDGGNTLSRNCSKISMRDVYQAINEDPLFATFDKEPNQECNISCQIGEVLCNAFRSVEKSTLLKMEDIKINDLAKKIKN